MVIDTASARRKALFLRNLLLCGAAAILPAAPAIAADEAAAAESADADQIQSSRDIVVQAEIGYRNRAEDEPEPVLVYGEEYFQRFEPLTAGDALKRVPSVTFLSDVIESDGARLRGLDPGYTQILINGEKVPGSNADRSFFLDRVPAELIKQVEIVRSSSARRTSDAVAGSLNIVLRDGYELDGGYIRAGGLLFDDGKVKPSVGAVSHIGLDLDIVERTAGLVVALGELVLGAAAALEVGRDDQSARADLATPGRAERFSPLAVIVIQPADPDVASVQRHGIAQNDVDRPRHRVALAIGRRRAHHLDPLYQLGWNAIHEEGPIHARARHPLAVDQDLGIAGIQTAQARAIRFQYVRQKRH